MGFVPTGIPAGRLPTTPTMVATPMKTMTTYASAPAPAGGSPDFASFPPGYASTPLPAPSSGGGILPGGALHMPSRTPSSGSTITPDGGPPADTSTSDPTTTIYDASQPVVDAATAQATSTLDALSRSYTVAAVLAGFGALSWFFGGKLRAVGLVALSGFVGYRAARS